MAEIAIKTDVAGSIWKIVTAIGQPLEAGETVMIVESMKMEIPVVTEERGTIARFLVEEKARVNEGQTVAILAT